MKSLSRPLRSLGCLVAVGLALQAAPARAVMLDAEAAMPAPAASQAELDRAKVQQFLDQAGVRERLQALGVAGLNARDRVAALDEQEVHALAQRIDAMPAGGRLGDNELIILLLVAILVLVAV